MEKVSLLTVNMFDLICSIFTSLGISFVSAVMSFPSMFLLLVLKNLSNEGTAKRLIPQLSFLSTIVNVPSSF